MAKRPPGTDDKKPKLTAVGRSSAGRNYGLSAKDQATLFSSAAKIHELFGRTNLQKLEMGDLGDVCKNLLTDEEMWLDFIDSKIVVLSRRTVQYCMAAARLRKEYLAEGGSANFAHISISAMFLLTGQKVSKALRNTILKRTNDEKLSYTVVDAEIAKALKPAEEKPAAKVKAAAVDSDAAKSSVKAVATKAEPEQLAAEPEQPEPERPATNEQSPSTASTQEEGIADLKRGHPDLVDRVLADDLTGEEAIAIGILRDTLSELKNKVPALIDDLITRCKNRQKFEKTATELERVLLMLIIEFADAYGAA